MMTDSGSATVLVAPRSIAKQKVEERIRAGKALSSLPARTGWNMNKMNAKLAQWCESVRALLVRVVSDESLAEEFGVCEEVKILRSFKPPTRDEVETAFEHSLEPKLGKLGQMLDWLDLIPEAPAVAESSQARPITGTKVFLVHGHDHGTKEMVARFVEKLGLEAIILHEQLSRSMTVIEKFEQHSDVAFAVVLLTPDDTGYPRSSPDQAKPRARQNVVLELGYFTGRLGRDRVCCLLKDDVEIPSDYAGVLYVSMDSDAWRLRLAKEMKAAGCPVDMNKV